MSEDESAQREEQAAKKVANFFKKAREDMGATQKDAAEISEITVGQLKQYEAATVMPRLTTARRLCDFYDASWEELGKIIGETLRNQDSEEQPESLESDASVFYELNKINNSEIRARGLHIVMERLFANGWEVTETNTTGGRRTNYDIRALKNGLPVKLKVTTKRHPEKTTLAVQWDRAEPTFNKNPGDKADYLVMVRYTDATDSECFVMSIEEAEEKADWLAEELEKLGNKPMYLQPYTSSRDRKTRFVFNTRKVWEDYSEAWEGLGVLECQIQAIKGASNPFGIDTIRWKRLELLKKQKNKITIRKFNDICRQNELRPAAKKYYLAGYKKHSLRVFGPSGEQLGDEEIAIIFTPER